MIDGQNDSLCVSRGTNEAGTFGGKQSFQDAVTLHHIFFPPFPLLLSATAHLVKPSLRWEAPSGHKICPDWRAFLTCCLSAPGEGLAPTGLNSHRQTRLLGNPPSYLQQSVIFTTLCRNTLLTSCVSAPAFCAPRSLSFSLAISMASPHTEHVDLCSVPSEP